jgi:hypothetical protein
LGGLNKGKRSSFVSNNSPADVIKESNQEEEDDPVKEVAEMHETD